MQINKLVILGGGTSGWMMAAALSKHLPNLGVTLIESQRVGTIGVGEGSTPLFKRFMQSLGIAEHVWMPACDASFKSGIYFDNWNGQNDRYFHPFFSELDTKTAEVFFVNANARRRGTEYPVMPDNYFLTGHIAKNNLSPKAAKPTVREQEYGYHFDAGKLANVLKEFATSNGVEHVLGDFDSAKQQSNGNITSLILKDGQHIDGDFFVDASGFNALLIEKTLNVAFEPFAHQLLNDSAVAVATHHSIKDNQVPLPSTTLSKALDCGWRWQIPLTSRFGNGYVYSSKHLSKQQAQQALAAELNIAENQAQFRHIKMRVGKSEKAWHKNVLALGLSQSFIEPIEATALMVTQYTIEQFIALLQTPRAGATDLLNSRLDNLINGIKDYVVGHYVTSKRRDTAYWREASKLSKAPEFVQRLLTDWQQGKDIDALISKYENKLAYFRPSWYCLLAGMDVMGENIKNRTTPAAKNIDEAAQAYLKQLATTHFMDHKKQLVTLTNQ